MCAGIGLELAGIDLGDMRLNRRSVKVLERLAAQPQASVNAACQGWGETMAAYRLFDHAEVSPEKILAPHQDATRERIRKQSTVPIVQDTTEPPDRTCRR